LAPLTSRIVRSGDLVRMGRMCLELRIEHSPITRDVAAATRDMALALVSEAMNAIGADQALRVRVLEGPDQGACLRLEDGREREREYLVGRAPHCDMLLADGDVSREHVRLVQRDRTVSVRDLGAKNGTWMGASRLPPHGELVWRRAHVVKVGGTVLGLEEPVAEALARIESAADELLSPDGEPAQVGVPQEPLPPAMLAADTTLESSSPALVEGATRDPLATTPEAPAADPSEQPGQSALRHPRRARRRVGPWANWSGIDLLVMFAALCVLGLSLAGLAWLLRG
jgi:pSer/pThr/pTyr-binding forkhead associated (FHA) protein